MVGEFEGTLTNNFSSHKEHIFVVRHLCNNLLGLPAITALQLIQRVDSVAKFEDLTSIIKQFPTVFKGLGTFGEDYTIKLKMDAKPYSIYTPPRVPFSLKTNVHEVLKRMEALGIITKVSVPTPWCAGMVVVRKKTGKVRIVPT